MVDQSRIFDKKINRSQVCVVKSESVAYNDKLKPEYAMYRKDKQKQEEFQKLGNQLAAQQLEQVGLYFLYLYQLQLQLATFKTNLQDFATKYAQDIRKDPTFRQHFHTMCMSIGVDPLACKFKVLYSSVQPTRGSGQNYWEQVIFIMNYRYKWLKCALRHDLRMEDSLN